MFKISNKILKSSHHITELKLCSVRLHDNTKFPWIILVPKKKYINEINDLSLKDQTLLMKEIVFSSKVMKKIFKNSKLNIEKIGNIVSQLHIHIIVRKKKDISWPLPVWVVKGKSYSANDLEEVVNKIKTAFNL